MFRKKKAEPESGAAKSTGTDNNPKEAASLGAMDKSNNAKSNAMGISAGNVSTKDSTTNNEVFYSMPALSFVPSWNSTGLQQAAGSRQVSEELEKMEVDVNDRTQQNIAGKVIKGEMKGVEPMDIDMASDTVGNAKPGSKLSSTVKPDGTAAVRSGGMASAQAKPGGGTTTSIPITLSGIVPVSVNAGVPFTPVQPGSVQSTPTKPGNVVPGSVKAGVPFTPVQPGSVQSTPTKPGGVQSAPAKPGGVQTTSAKPGGVQTTPAKPGGVQSAPAKPGGVQTTSAKPGGVQTTPAKPGGVQSTALSGSVASTIVKSGGLPSTPAKSGGVIATPPRISRAPPPAVGPSATSTPIRPRGAASTPLRSSGATTPLRPSGVTSTPVKAGSATPSTVESVRKTYTKSPPGGVGLSDKTPKKPLSSEPAESISSRGTSKPRQRKDSQQHLFSQMTVAAVMEQLANVLDSSQLETKYTDNTETQYAIMAVTDIVNKLDQLKISQTLPDVGGVGKVTGSPYTRMTLGDIIDYLEHLAQTLGTLDVPEGPQESRYMDKTVGEIMIKLGQLIGETDVHQETVYAATPYAHMTFGDIMKIATRKVQDERDEELESLHERVSVSDMIRKFEQLSGIHGGVKTREYLMKIPYTTMSVAGLANKLMEIVAIIEQAGKESSEVKNSTMTLREVLPYLERIVGISLTTPNEIDLLDPKEDKRGNFMESAYAGLSIVHMLQIFQKLATLYYNMSGTTKADITKFTIADIICESDIKGRSNESTEILWALMNVASIVYRFENRAAEMDHGQLEKIIKNKKFADDILNRNRNAAEVGRRVKEVSSLLRHEESEDSTAFYTCTTTTPSSRYEVLDEDDRTFQSSELQSQLKKIRAQHKGSSSSSDSSSSSTSSSTDSGKDQSDLVKLAASDPKNTSALSGVGAGQVKGNISSQNADQSQPDWSHLQLITKYYTPPSSEDQFCTAQEILDKSASPSPKRVVIKDGDKTESRQVVKRPPARDEERTLASLPTQTISLSGDAITATAENEILNLTCDLNRSSSPSNSHRVIATMSGMGSRMLVADLKISVIDRDSEQQTSSSTSNDNRDTDLWNQGIGGGVYIHNDFENISQNEETSTPSELTGSSLGKFPTTGVKKELPLLYNTPMSSIHRNRHKGRIEKNRKRLFKGNQRPSKDLKPTGSSPSSSSNKIAANRRPGKVLKPTGSSPSSSSNKIAANRRPDKDSKPSGSSPSSSSNKIAADCSPNRRHGTSTSKRPKSVKYPAKGSSERDNKMAERFLFVRPARSSSSGSDPMGNISLDFNSPGSSAGSCSDGKVPTDIQFLLRKKSASSSTSSEDEPGKKIMFVRPTRSTSSGSDVEEMDDKLVIHATKSSSSASSGEFDIRELPYILELKKRELSHKKVVQKLQ